MVSAAGTAHAMNEPEIVAAIRDAGKRPQRRDMTYERLAEPVPGPLTDAFAARARELGVVVVLNLFERDGARCYDCSPVIDADGRTISEDLFHASRSVLQEVVRRGEPVFMTEGLEGDLAEQKSIVAMNLRAVGCMPLRRRGGSEDELIGILYLDSRATMHNNTSSFCS